MTHFNFKRAMAALMVVMMLVGILPMNVFAGRVVVGDADINKPVVDDTDIDVSVETTTDLANFVEDMEGVYAKYLGNNWLSAKEIDTRVSGMDDVTLQAAKLDIIRIEDKANDLSEDELSLVLESYSAFVDFASSVMNLTQDRQLARATNISMFDGLLSITDNNGSGSLSGTNVTITAKGSLISKKTNNITITNKATVTKKLSFDYSVTSASSHTFSSNSGSVEVVLNPGDTYTATIVSKYGWSDLTVTLKLTNIAFVDVATSANVTVNYDAALGSVTFNGASVAAGELLAEVSTDADSDFVATVATGAKFIAWIDGDGKILTTGATLSVTPSGDMTVEALFSNSSSAPIWKVGEFIYKDFAVAASKGGTMILMNDATLPAGDYTVPAGTTLLVPYNADNTLRTTSPATVAPSSFGVVPSISRYRTLYMADGANITVNGAISVSGSQQAGGGIAGAPTGALGFIEMKGNNNITVNRGASLYCWGYIIGQGGVLAKNGATVYEDFVVADWRGGSSTASMANDDHGVFPFSQYYVQNIEVPLTYEAGAIEYGFMSVNISVIGIQPASVPFIGNGSSMFNVNSGTVTKYYDGTKDRLVVQTEGDISMDPLTVSMKLGIFGSSTIDSKKYELPITSNLTAYAKSGNISINQDIAMLPGSQIVVGEEAVCVLGKGINVYAYDADQWGGYCTSSSIKFKNNPNAPGRKYVRTEADLVDAMVQVDGYIDASAGYLYTTAGGANVTSSMSGRILVGNPGTQTATEQAKHKEDSAEYVSIAIVPALLTNANGSVTNTNAVKNLYTYTNGMWNPCAHNMVAEGYVAPTCTTTGFTNREYCTICNIEYVERSVLDVIAHTEVVDKAVAPTCTEAGLTEGKHCSVCGTVTVAQDTVPALEHDYAVVTTAPTCTVAGKSVYTCNACGYSYTENIDAPGHTEVVDKAVEPTCTEAGYSEGKHCDVCGEVIVAQEVKDALGHSEVIDDAVVPTCTETGLTEGVHCDVCGEVLVAQEPIDALGHTEVVDEAVAPTCTGTGLTVGRHCIECGEVIVAQEVVDALGHSYEAERISPDCTEKGSVTYTCTLCGDTYTETIDALGHTEVVDEAVAPTCTETGLTEGKHCSVCNVVTVAQETVDALGHTEVVDEAVAPTCTEAGLTEGKHCSVCNVVTVAQETVDALGHTEVVDEAVAATCTETGLTEGKHCSVCNVVTVVQETVDALGHTEVVDEAVAPTCTETGLTEGKHCSVCKVVTVAQETVDALGHTEVVDEAVAPTCTETGLTEGKHCSVCNVVTVAQETVDALGHTWSTWTVVTDPTTTSVGLKQRSCYVCGATESREIPVLDPNAPSLISSSNYTVVIDNINNIKEIRYAIGYYTTGAEVKAAEKNQTLSAALVNSYTTNGVMTYEVPWIGEYTFWVRFNDGSSYFLYFDITEIHPYLTSDGLRLTVNDFGENYKDMWIAEGTWNSYSEIKNNVAETAKYQAAATKLSNYFAFHDFTYTTSNPGAHTVLIRYNDGTQDVMHINLTVDVPTFTWNGLQLTIGNIPGVKIIRSAYGTYNSIAEIKTAPLLRCFNNKTAIKDAEEYMIQYRENGEITVIVEYATGYKHVEHLNVVQKESTCVLDGNTVTIGDLESGFVMVRYAEGTYKTPNGVKNAEGSKYVKEATDGKIVVEDLAPGNYTFYVQYDDESYNFHYITVE